MAVVFDHPKSLLDVSTHFCPGCGHGIVHRLVCEVIDEMGIEGDTIGVVPVGCSVMSYNYFGCDVIEAPHGRAPAVATGAKRVNPDKFVFSYQGDGDLAAIGTAETVHVGTRGENIVVIFINNTIRLSITARRREIAIMRLVGASNGFIRGPFITEGVLQAILGSLLSIGVLELLRNLMIPRLQESIGWMSFALPMQYYLVTYAALILVGVIIGLFGSAIAMRRYLRV